MKAGLVIDNFAGGGGASTGIEAALGRSIDVAINHDAEAIAMHKANHPGARHYCQSVWSVDPLDVVNEAGGVQVALAWFSPDCKHFSKAKGGKPVEKHIRDLAWVVVHWVERLKSRDRFGLVTVSIEGVEYAIADIGMRMLSARELYNAQGFPADYEIEPEFNGKTLNKTAQVRMCGNSVSPVMPEALVRANLPELCAAQAVAA